ncbi:diguanylate cyclase/phosphodiesterase with PAS/PAC sensor(s) [Sphingomonas sp. PP-F2F-A104-K0414]|uniref:putative bifunctional diguanylate cyclase/phosphodiesterase n=1 Tax=Sphingomonas sp. PP-F2F-A104-K0414 TaxID=2135661 RepID=UPI00104EB380|nr:EAL domain-containing protein [Sphingomonas sp. PP-F2F-A104-K0414]TCP98663.1 diguanylate cyclase/phosphodiesterase with PAS/PAC sensor(s) [Sphingomonas sp. PP-F2F-A104-K0414]
MTKTPPSASSRIVVDLATLLAIREGGDPVVWGRIRAAQLFAGRRVALFLLTSNIVAMLAIAFLLRGVVPHWQIAAWAALVAAAAVWVGFRRLATDHRGDGYASLRQLRHTIWDGFVLALVWSAVPVFFCTHAPTGTTAGLGLTLAVLMAAAALAMAPLAPATLVFLGYLGVAMAIQLAFASSFAAALGLLLFTGLLMVACIHRARALIMLRASEIVLDDRNETVSLLLGEFDGTGADWLWETDATRRVVKASPRFAFACGLDPATINGLPLLQLLAGPSWETGEFDTALRILAERLKRRESFRDVRLPVQIGGEDRWWSMAASPRFDDHGEFYGFRGVGSDVTEQRASADKINRMARFDTLTGLPNRLMVNETLVKAMADADRWGGRYAFMMLDLDRFKAVNDTLGHPIGDRLLGRVSERIHALMGVNETCGRLGGDEFAVVVRDASDAAAVERLAERIIASLSRPYEIDAHTLHIGASIGLAIGPRDGRTADMLIRSADLALYRAKDAGRGVFRRYEPELHVQAEERRILEMALRDAIEKGEMHLVYQPIVETDSALPCGFEALLRWTSAEFGCVSPAKFIPLAEETRLIGPIGAWVVRTACEEAALWPSDMRIAVNVSADQLRNPSFVTTIASALASTGVSPERLELEVTEGVFMHEGLGATQILDRVAELGVRLSLDDFGTGHSSLGYLSRTRFSSLKIDRNFVRDAACGVREAVAIVRAGIALATSLGMATTAEGIETEAELRALRDLGCSNAQGFYFGRPMSAEDARSLANRGWKDAVAA